MENRKFLCPKYGSFGSYSLGRVGGSAWGPDRLLACPPCACGLRQILAGSRGANRRHQAGEVCALGGVIFVLQRISIMFLKAKGHFQFAGS